MPVKQLRSALIKHYIIQTGGYQPLVSLTDVKIKVEGLQANFSVVSVNLCDNKQPTLYC